MIKTVSNGGFTPPDFPPKEELPRLFITVESHKSDVKENSVRVFMDEPTGGRNFHLPIDGDDLDASELTWEITKMIKKWIGLKT